MPRIKFTKSTIDTLPIPESDIVYWDAGGPGFGMKVGRRPAPCGFDLFGR